MSCGAPCPLLDMHLARFTRSKIQSEHSGSLWVRHAIVSGHSDLCFMSQTLVLQVFAAHQVGVASFLKALAATMCSTHYGNSEIQETL